MPKISYEELRAKLMDPNVPDAEIAPYLMAVPSRSGPFDPHIVPDPEAVALGPEGNFEVESAMRWGNGVSRWRRRITFSQRANVETLPILVSEGDSWFQFPFLIQDVIDHLNPHYLISSLDAAGDTAHNMVYGAPEYMTELKRLKSKNVAAFLFSGAGNDVIGEDEHGNPVLATLLKPFAQGQSPAWHIDHARLAQILQFLEQAYRDVVATIREEAVFATLPILIHGYDYVIPGGFPGDTRNPSWAARDKWLGSAFKVKRIADPQMQREIIQILIDALYDMLARIAGKAKDTHVHLVDLRKAVEADEWADEIHPTDAGFQKVAARFRKTLKAAGVS